LLREEMVTLEEGLKITDFTTNYPSEIGDFPSTNQWLKMSKEVGLIFSRK